MNRVERAALERRFRVLVLAGLALIVGAYFAPMWWVSLKAPQYPPDTFPKGVRIHMHWYGVTSGCPLPHRAEVTEREAVDCVHEMNTINHYIGMEPIDRGARLEFAAAPYLFVAMAVLLLLSLFYRGRGWWLMILPAAVAPAVFVLDFAFWLWWFGHHLHPWAAFTVKPFMPTVLGVGRVAQFHTYSYPHYGFALSVASSLSLLLALLTRRRQILEERAAASGGASEGGEGR